MADLGNSVRCWVITASAAFGLCQAQAQPGHEPGTSFTGGFSLHRTANPVGFNIARAEYRLPCSITVLHCRTTELGLEHSRNWSLELGLQDLGRAGAAPGWRPHPAQAVNLSLLGRRPLFGLEQLNVYGKVGTSYGFTDPSPVAGIGGADSGVGLSYGAGLSMDFSPRLSATLGWDNHDFRFSSGLRDVRSTSIGLQYRY